MRRIGFLLVLLTVLFNAKAGALPSFGVTDLTGWIVASGSVNVSMVVDGVTYNFRRMQAPL
jgi:hypothetical protein